MNARHFLEEKKSRCLQNDTAGLSSRGQWGQLLTSPTWFFGSIVSTGIDVFVWEILQCVYASLQFPNRSPNFYWKWLVKKYGVKRELLLEGGFCWMGLLLEEARFVPTVWFNKLSLIYDELSSKTQTGSFKNKRKEIISDREMNVKAFDICPAVSDFSAKVVCLEGSGNNLFVGTSQGGVISFSVHETVDASGKCRVACEEWAASTLPTKKAITQLKSTSALNRLLVLSDNVLFQLQMQNLQSIGQLAKSVSCFAVNDNPTSNNPFTIQIAIATSKKQLLVGEITKDKLKIIREIAIDDVGLCLGYDGHNICYATGLCYHLIQDATGESQDLFPFDIIDTAPFITRISKEEFFLNSPGSLGMFVNSCGMSQRPPINWNMSKVHNASYIHPYIVALGSEFLSVYNVTDQKQKQVLPFKDAVFVGCFDGQVYVSSANSVYKLIPLPWHKQVQTLLAEKHVKEALELAVEARKLGVSHEDFEQIFRRLKQEAAFIYIEMCQWNEAAELFIDTATDLREVISLYHGLMPQKSDFVPSLFILHKLTDVAAVVKDSTELDYQSKEFLLELLLTARLDDHIDTSAFVVELDTAVLKLMAHLSQYEQFVEFMRDNCHCDPDDCKRWFEDSQHYQALAFYRAERRKFLEAFELWHCLADGTKFDPDFNDLSVMFDYLIECEDVVLVLDTITWILDRDAELSLKVLTRYRWPERIDSEHALSMLRGHQDALEKYLEYLVYEQNLQKESVHTQLVMIYLENAQSALKSLGFGGSASSKLLKLLRTSDLYRSSHVLSLLEKDSQTPFHRERATVLGKIGDYEKALLILVRDAKDYEAAEEFCKDYCAGKKRRERQLVYQKLIEIYLDPKTGGPNELVVPVTRLLNSAELEVDLLQMLNILPSHWALTVLSSFVRQTVAKTTCASTVLRLERLLSKAYLDRLNCEKFDLIKRPIVIQDKSRCAICDRLFYDSTCFVFPTGVVAHRECVQNKNVCPQTGEVFSIHGTRPS